MRRLLIAVVFLCASALAQVQLVEVPAFTATVADQKCQDWAWAAALDTVLRLQELKLGQRYWITKLRGGEVCNDDFTDFERLPRLIDGEYTRDDGSKVRVSSTYTSGAPNVYNLIAPLIVALGEGRPLILFWKGHAYVLYGLVYNQYVVESSGRVLAIREMKLRDPYFTGSKQFVTFFGGSNDPKEINGVMQVTVTPIEQRPWKNSR